MKKSTPITYSLGYAVIMIALAFIVFKGHPDVLAFGMIVVATIILYVALNKTDPT